jgi:hypothetical protein
VQELQTDPLKEFYDAIRSPVTRRKYELRLAQFLDYAGAKGDTLSAKARDFTEMARKDYDRTTFTINSFLQEQKARAEAGEINASTISIYKKPLVLFCEMNDIPINWKKISRKLPTGRHYADDRAPSREEIKTLLTYPDRRIKPLLLLMVSSGIRIGAWEWLNWGHIELVKRNGQIVAAKLKVYPGDAEQYSTFVSREAYNAIAEYIAYRESAGEKIGPNTPVLRDLFPPDRGATLKHSVGKPKRLEANGVKRLLEDALKGTGLRRALPEGKRRHDWQGAHGFRKFFKSAAERHMKTLHVEILLGHDTGLNESYYRPKEEELLEDYQKALPDLTILEKPEAARNPDVEILSSRVEELTQKLAFLSEELVRRGIIPEAYKGEDSEALLGKAPKLNRGVL